MSFLKWLDKNFEYVCLAFFLVIMTVLSFANVILRYCFNFCLSCSIRHRSAIRVDTLTVMLPKAVQNVLNYVCNAIMIVFMGFCIKGGLEVAANAASVNQKSPALQIPVAGLYHVMTFCFALSIFRLVQICWRYFWSFLCR